MILIVEDGRDSMDFVSNLISLGYTVKWVNNLDDAVYYVEEKPGHLAFDAVILDMDMLDEGLPEEAMDTAFKIYPGYAFYEHVLKISPRLQEKTIVLSEFTETLKEKIAEEKYKKLKVVSKKDTARLDIINKTLLKWGVARSVSS